MNPKVRLQSFDLSGMEAKEHGASGTTWPRLQLHNNKHMNKILVMKGEGLDPFHLPLHSTIKILDLCAVGGKGVGWVGGRVGADKPWTRMRRRYPLRRQLR